MNWDQLAPTDGGEKDWTNGPTTTSPPPSPDRSKMRAEEDRPPQWIRVLKGDLIMRLMTTLLLLSSSSMLLAADQEKAAQRLKDAADVMTDIMATPDKGVPRDLLEKARCVVIVPGMKKGAFIVGAQYGKGFISCREDGSGPWSAPGAVRIEGGSVGFQIGGSETDVVLLVMNDKGAEKLLSSQFTLGGEGEVAAGPVGRTASAETDAKMSAEILSWSRSHGIFAGLSLQGATLRQDLADNRELYGKRIANREIVRGKVSPPPAAAGLLDLLQKYPLRNKS